MRRNWVANEKTRHFTTEPNFKSMREKNVKKMKMFVEKHIEWIYQKLTMVPCASQSWRNIYTHFSYTKNHWDSFINSLIWEWMRDSTESSIATRFDSNETYYIIIFHHFGKQAAKKQSKNKNDASLSFDFQFTTLIRSNFVIVSHLFSNINTVCRGFDRQFSAEEIKFRMKWKFVHLFVDDTERSDSANIFDFRERGKRKRKVH